MTTNKSNVDAAVMQEGSKPIFRVKSGGKTLSANLSNLSTGLPYRGHVDNFNGRIVNGWVLSTQTPTKPVCIDLFLFNTRMATIVPELSRDDISSAVGFPIKSGFTFSISDSVASSAHDVLTSLKNNTSKELVGDLEFVARIEGTEYVLPVPDKALKNFSLGNLREALNHAALAYYENNTVSVKLQIANNLDRLSEEKTSDHSVGIIAYYLPQFHPFDENSEWWGEGFTEWTNVASAKPLFDGHNQPRLPADLGFYDLRLDDAHKKQIELAKEYSIKGFCYYYYWFSGKTLMTLPIDRHLQLNYDLDFCLCWANENWSRRWDGSDHDVLLKQQHNFDSDVSFIKDCIKYFRSERYIKVDGAPFIQIYRVSLINNAREVIGRWKEIVKNEGFPDLHVCMVESFGLSNPYEYGCDSSCQFPPHGVNARQCNEKVSNLNHEFHGKIYDYDDVITSELARPKASHMQIRACMPSWDNTSRKGCAGNVFHNASPEKFEIWLNYLIANAHTNLPNALKFVFINAWNEWAEGAYLEPDAHNGKKYLQTVLNALSSQDALLPSMEVTSDISSRKVFDHLISTIKQLRVTNKVLTNLISKSSHLSLGRPKASFVEANQKHFTFTNDLELKWHFDRLNKNPVLPPGQILTLQRSQGMSLEGWAIEDGKKLGFCFVALKSKNKLYLATMMHRNPRPDVAATFDLSDKQAHYGFVFDASLDEVSSDLYTIEIVRPDDKVVNLARVLSTGRRILVG